MCNYKLNINPLVKVAQTQVSELSSKMPQGSCHFFLHQKWDSRPP
jgi:hypothetical protein